MFSLAIQVPNNKSIVLQMPNTRGLFLSPESLTKWWVHGGGTSYPVAG